MNPKRIGTGLAAILFAVTPALAQHHVWVVDDDGGVGVDFTDIQPAIDASADRDVILVRGGSYEGFQIIGRSIVIVADDGTLVTLRSPSLVNALSSGQEVVLRGLTCLWLSSGSGSFFQALDNTGELWIEDCTFGVDYWILNPGSPPAIDLQNCSNVSLLRCAAFGPPGRSGGTYQGGDGLHITASEVSLHGGSVTGGSTYLGIGSAGIVIDGGEVLLSGCEVTGGDGGMGSACFPGAGDLGGSALVVNDGAAWHQDSILLGGRKGHPFDTYCGGYGPRSPGIEQNGGTIATIAGVARRLTAPSPVRENDTVTFELEGAVGDVPFLLISFGAAHALRPEYSGPLLLAEPVFLFSGGTLTGVPPRSLVTFPVPNLAAPVQGWTIYAQAVFVGSAPPGTPIRLGSATAVTVVDPAF